MQPQDTTKGKAQVKKSTAEQRILQEVNKMSP